MFVCLFFMLVIVFIEMKKKTKYNVFIFLFLSKSNGLVLLFIMNCSIVYSIFTAA
jgi:hypothetical protein